MTEWLPIIAAAIAVLGAGIAFGQWYTARSKLALDLFDRRMQTYEALRAVAAKVMTSGISDSQDIADWSKAQTDALFLFGGDVEAYLEGLRHSLIHMHTHRTMQGDPSLTSQERAEHVRKEQEQFRIVVGFYGRFPQLLGRYARMDQRRPLWRLWSVLRPRRIRVKP